MWCVWLVFYVWVVWCVWLVFYVWLVWCDGGSAIFRLFLGPLKRVIRESGWYVAMHTI